MTHMTDFMTIGRPYARAAFECAKESKMLDEWQSMLSILAHGVMHPEVASLLKKPSNSATQAVELCAALLPQAPDIPQQNFIKLLAEHTRLFALPAIFSLFMTFRSEAEETLPVTVVSAMSLSESDLKKIKIFLKGKFNQKVTLKTEVDKSLISGVLIRAGDYVIDNSVRGQLERLRRVAVN